MERLYVVTREDLPPGLQLAQSCHAVSQFSDNYPELYREWLHGANNIVCLAVPDEPALQALIGRAREKSPTSFFIEPDLGGELTAIALGDAAKRLVSRLPLALREVA